MATIKDVAKKAALSVSTVSRFLNNHPYISDEKRKKIEAAMAELNYEPSAFAQQMRGIQTYRIGILISRITNQFVASLIDSLEVTARKYGYSIIIVQNHDSEGEEKKCLELLRKKIIDGLILCSFENEESNIKKYLEFGPIVICNTHVENNTIPNIVVQDIDATKEAIKYLIKKGHSKIAYCTGGDFTDTSHGCRRNIAFKEVMKEHGLSIVDEYVYRNIHTFDDGKMVADSLLSMDLELRPTAVFTGSDEVASGLISQAQKYNIRIPDDLSVIGFDDQRIASLMSIPMTTISQPVDKLGAYTMEYLISIINRKEYRYDQHELEAKFIIRQSA